VSYDTITVRAAVDPPVARLAAAVAGAALVIAELLYLVVGLAVPDPSSGLATVQAVLFLVGLALLVVALAGLRHDAFDRARPLAAIGFPLALVGTVLNAGGLWTDLFVVPGIAAGAPELVTAGPDAVLTTGYVLSSAVFVLGWATVGVAALRARAWPRAAALLLVVGAVVSFVPAPLTFVPFGVAVAWIGLQLRGADDPARTAPGHRA
jgi:hypothetical protein